jgi:hypothetical protein
MAESWSDRRTLNLNRTLNPGPNPEHCTLHPAPTRSGARVRPPSRRIDTVLAAALALLIVLPAAASAQITTGTVTGSIRETTGLPVPGATATLISETRRTKPVDAVSNLQGDFVFANVPPDRYTIRVTMQGFKTFNRSDLVISAGDRASTGALTLEVGGGAEFVPVRAKRRSSTPLPANAPSPSPPKQ